MAESLFDIFGDHLTKHALKNISRQPLSNIENMGKSISTGPIKPNESVKKIGEPKKSFLSNTGKAFQSTPARKAFTPRTVNVGTLIYSDAETGTENANSFEAMEFTKPSYKYDNYHKDALDCLPMLPELELAVQNSPPATPPPSIRRHSMEFNCSYQDEFFTDDFSLDSLPEDSDLNLPELY